jgi:hypothetical protein
MFQWFDDHDARIMVNIDGESWTEWTGSRDISDGEHNIQAYAIDGAGLKSAVIAIEIKVDTSYPETKVRMTGAMNGEWFTSIPLIIFDQDDDSLTYYRWDEEIDMTMYDSPISPTLNEGRTLLRYHSRDIAGNVEDELAVEIRLDIKDPVPVLEYSVSEDGFLRMSGESSRDGTRIQYLFTVDGRAIGGWSYEPDTEIHLDPGIHQLRMDVRDEAGNTASRSATVEVERQNLIPLLIGGSVAIVVIGVVFLLIMIRRKPGYEIEYSEDFHYQDRGW